MNAFFFFIQNHLFEVRTLLLLPVAIFIGLNKFPSGVTVM